MIHISHGREKLLEFLTQAQDRETTIVNDITRLGNSILKLANEDSLVRNVSAFLLADPIGEFCQYKTFDFSSVLKMLRNELELVQKRLAEVRENIALLNKRITELSTINK